MNTNTKFEMVLPTGEFKIKDLIKLNNKSQPVIYQHLKKAIQSGKAKEVRRESNGKGRPSVVYVQCN